MIRKDILAYAYLKRALVHSTNQESIIKPSGLCTCFFKTL